MDKLAIDGVQNPMGGAFRASEQWRSQAVVNMLRAALAKAEAQAKRQAMVTPAAAAAAAGAESKSAVAQRPPPTVFAPGPAGSPTGDAPPRRVVQELESVASDDEGAEPDEQAGPDEQSKATE